MGFGSLSRMMRRLKQMSMGQVGLVRCLLELAAFITLSRFLMVPGSKFMMFRSLMMV
jgi:hypothetical protein